MPQPRKPHCPARSPCAARPRRPRAAGLHAYGVSPPDRSPEPADADGHRCAEPAVPDVMISEWGSGCHPFLKAPLDVIGLDAELLNAELLAGVSVASWD